VPLVCALRQRGGFPWCIEAYWYTEVSGSI
jgi:hypothetical protein